MISSWDGRFSCNNNSSSILHQSRASPNLLAAARVWVLSNQTLGTVLMSNEELALWTRNPQRALYQNRKQRLGQKSGQTDAIGARLSWLASSASWYTFTHGAGTRWGWVIELTTTKSSATHRSFGAPGAESTAKERRTVSLSKCLCVCVCVCVWEWSVVFN